MPTSPGKFGSPSIFALVGGYDILAAKVKQVISKIEALQEPHEGCGDGSKASIPTGMAKASFEQSGGFFDTAALSSHAAFSSAVPSSPQTAARVVCCGFAGMSIGENFWGFQGLHSASYVVLAQNEMVTKANASHVAAGTVDRGVIVQALETRAADWNTKSLGTQIDYANDLSQTVIPITSNSQANPTVITTPNPHGLVTGDIIVISGVTGSSPTINGERTVTVLSTTSFSVPVNTSAGTGGTGGSFVRANSANGGVGYLQVTACTGFTNFVGKLRDSADDVTYADLITFTDNVVAPFAERVTVAGVVDRYLSFNGDVTGTGSIRVFCGFART